MTHNVNINDTDANYLAWGKLVQNWVDNPGNRPNTVAEFNAALAAHGIQGKANGAPDRGITFVQYSDDPGDAIIIPLPSGAMMLADQNELNKIAGHPAGHRTYPLPKFYALIFGGAAKVDFTRQHLYDMQARRIGEYVINECM